MSLPIPKKIRNPIVLPMLIAVVSGALAVSLNLVATGAILFLMFASIAFMSASKKPKLAISIGAIVVAFSAGVVVVLTESVDITQWYVMKIVFVIYFAVFAGYIISKYFSRYQNLLVFAMGVSMFICFALQHFFLSAPSVSGAPVYNWPTLFQDLCFGIAAAIAAELFNPAPSTKTP